MEYEPDNELNHPADERTEPGDLMFPERFPRDEVEYLKTKLGNDDSVQYQAEPSASRRWPPQTLVPHMGQGARYGVVQIRKPEITCQGFLRAGAVRTRAGVFTYRNPDGRQCREYRPPDEVFHSTVARRTTCLLDISLFYF